MSLNQTLGNNIIHHLVRLIEHLLCHGAARLIFEDVRVPLVRVFAAQIVQAEEWAPIDVLADFIQVVLLEGNVPNSNWLRRGVLSEINLHALGLRLLDREPLLVHEPLVVLGPDLVRTRPGCRPSSPARRTQSAAARRAQPGRRPRRGSPSCSSARASPRRGASTSSRRRRGAAA